MLRSLFVKEVIIMKTRIRAGNKILGALVSAAIVFSMLPAMMASADNSGVKEVTLDINQSVSNGNNPTFSGINIAISGGDGRISRSNQSFQDYGKTATTYTFSIPSTGDYRDGKITKIEISYSKISRTSIGSGWTNGNNVLTWTGTASPSVALSLSRSSGKKNDTGYIAFTSIKVYVTVPITSETIDAMTVFVGDGAVALTTSHVPSNTTFSDSDLTWTSSATDYATVAYNSESGKVEVTPVAAGQTTITASLGSTTLGSATITVYEHVSGVTLSEVSGPVFSDDDPFEITATATNEASIKPGSYTISWESSNPSIASVSDTGVVTPAAPGDVTITATLTDTTKPEGSGVFTGTATFKVYSSDEPVVVVIPSTLELTTDSDPVALDYSVEAPEGHNITLVEFYCEDEDVITVDPETGVVTPVGVGEATVEVWVYDELLDDGFCGTCAVTVSEPSPEPEPPTPGPEPTPEPTSEEPSLTPEQIQRMAVNHFVERLYVEGLGRSFDVAGRDGWTDILMNGGSASAVVRGFFGSSEFIGLNTSNEEFVTRLYKVFFDRTPDTEGFNNWVTALNNEALTRAQVVDEFAHSPEWAAFCARYSVNV